MPHHSAPRLGSVCPHSGIAPWAAAKGHPWPSAANPASMPGCPLHNACVRPAWLTGRRDQRPSRGGLVADLTLPVVHPLDLWEQSLLAKRPAHPTSPQADTSPSRASPLPHSISSGHKIYLAQTPCGSELARDEAGTPSIHVTEPPPSRASSLPPPSFPQEARGLIKNQVGYQAASRWTLISGAPLTTLAERRCCGVGIPAWMPG